MDRRNAFDSLLLRLFGNECWPSAISNGVIITGYWPGVFIEQTSKVSFYMVRGKHGGGEAKQEVTFLATHTSI